MTLPAALYSRLTVLTKCSYKAEGTLKLCVTLAFVCRCRRWRESHSLCSGSPLDVFRARRARPRALEFSVSSSYGVSVPRVFELLVLDTEMKQFICPEQMLNGCEACIQVVRIGSDAARAKPKSLLEVSSTSIFLKGSAERKIAAGEVKGKTCDRSE